ncbi:hypothetical protein MUO65_05870 [bacterium]|nr:hypothetical protein [bacterium]
MELVALLASVASIISLIYQLLSYYGIIPQNKKNPFSQVAEASLYRHFSKKPISSTIM